MLDGDPQEVRDQFVHQRRLARIRHFGTDRPGREQRDVDSGVAQFAAQRLAECVGERLARGVGGVVGNRGVSRGRTRDQDATGPARGHARQNGQNQVVHTEHVELNLGFLGGGIKVGHRAEGGGAGVGAQDRDVPPSQLIGQ